ncbi:ABC transporter ATP-binding protein [Vibrio sp. RC27]
MNSPIIAVNSVKKIVSTNEEQLTIISDANFEIFAGESVAIVGTSGAGKSTLMTLISGLDTASEGDVAIMGKSMNAMDDEQRAQLRSQSIGFVFQSFLLIPTLSALENVTLPSLLRGDNEDPVRATKLLEQVGLGKRIHHLPSQLSGGEQQRVAIARAFMLNPQILFADEPTGNLDSATSDKIIELLFSLNQSNGTTLVLVTHDLALAARCDRRLHMESGVLREVE